MRLTEKTLLQAVKTLSDLDADLARVVARHGPPPLWAREPGFATLVWMILEQQVSLASAKAAFDKLRAVVPVTPENVLTLDDSALRAIGFSRQKMLYVRLLARAILDGFDLDGLGRLDDAEARERLTQLKGIGNWTADVYLMMALGRPDVWPVGDLGLQVGVQEVKGLAERPVGETLTALGEPYRPWRAVATRIFWHAYLSKRSGNAKTLAPVEEP